MLLILTSCSNEPNDNNENITHNKQEFNLSSIIGKWKLTDSNPILEGEIISEYFEDDTFKQNGVIKSFQPSYTCQMSSNGTFMNYRLVRFKTLKYKIKLQRVGLAHMLIPILTRISLIKI